MNEIFQTIWNQLTLSTKLIKSSEGGDDHLLVPKGYELVPVPGLEKCIRSHELRDINDFVAWIELNTNESDTVPELFVYEAEEVVSFKPKAIATFVLTPERVDSDSVGLYCEQVSPGETLEFLREAFAKYSFFIGHGTPVNEVHPKYREFDN